MRTPARTRGRSSRLLQPFWHSTTLNTKCSNSGMREHGRRRSSQHRARPRRGRTSWLTLCDCHLRRLAAAADDRGSTAQVPTDDAHQCGYVAACYHARKGQSTGLRKRRHRGRYQRSRDALDGRAVLFCKRRRSWMRIGPSRGTESRGQRRSRTGGRASGELPSMINRRLQLVSDLEQDGRGDARSALRFSPKTTSLALA